MSLMLADYLSLLSALGWTAVLAAAGTVLAALLGLPLALILRSGCTWLKIPVRCYVELMRGVPLVVLLFLFYYGGPTLGIRMSSVLTGIVGLALFGSGAFAEIYRAGLQAVPTGEKESARMLGLSRLSCFMRIELPRAGRLILAPITSQVILMIKESSVLSIITVAELTKTADQLSSYTFSVAPYVIAALGYWALVEFIAHAGFRLERHFIAQSEGAL